MVKKWIYSFIPQSVKNAVHGRRTAEWAKSGYFGFNGLDKKLEKYVDYDNGFYVELGAFDGITQSNSYHFELKRGWKGVLVEPTPHNFLACYKLRGQKNSIYCNACVGFDYKEKFVEIKYASGMSVSTDLDLDLEVDKHLDSAQKHFKASGEKVFSFGAVSRPLSHILDESKAPSIIDFLSLDVEGAELEVLSGIDFQKYTFKFMLIECRNIDRLESFLNGKNYKLIEKLSFHDYLFKFDSL